MPKDPKAPEREAEVSKWLFANNAERFKDAFGKQGYNELEDVTDDVIDQIVGKEGGMPGLAAKLKRALPKPEPKRDDNEKEKNEPLKAPELPAGTPLDLSMDSPTPPQGIQWKLPADLSVSAGSGTVVSPSDLNSNDWILLAKRSNLLYGYKMDKDTPIRGNSPVRIWKVPGASDCFYSGEEGQSLITTSLNYTAQSSSYVAAHMDTESATASYLFCSASFERSHNERRAGTQYSQTLYMTGLWQYPRATLYLDKCTNVSPAFVKDVEQALSQSSEDKQVTELTKVFDQYGHAAPQVVVLGGPLSFQSVHKAQGIMDARTVQDTIKAAVEVKGKQAGGSASFGFDDGYGNKVTADSISDSVVFEATGGDTTKNGNPGVWAETVKDPHNWRVIALHGISDDLGSDGGPRSDGMISTVDLLPRDLIEKVKNLWSKVGVPPAILDLEPIRPRENAAQVGQVTEDAFYLAIRTQLTNGSRGYVNLVSGPSADPPEAGDAPNIASAAAYAHWYSDHDTWYKHSSICMPVPAGNHVKLGSYTTSGDSNAQAARVPTTLKFGAWCQAFPAGLKVVAETQHRAESDGFLVVCVWTSLDGPRGGALAFIDGENVAGASIHVYSEHDAHISAQSLCVPVPAGSVYRVQPKITNGDVGVRAYWLPMVDNRWMMKKAKKRGPNTTYTADESDGILHGWIQSRSGERGSILCYAGPDASAPNPSASHAAASVHYDEGPDKWILWSSVMLPVAKNADYKVATDFTFGNPLVNLYWTAIVPRKPAP